MAGTSAFTEKIGETICEGLEDGESLLSVCRRLNLKESTVRKWTRMFPATFGANYARAREDGDDIEFERLWVLASEKPPACKSGTDSGWVNWKRLQIDTAKWMLARKRPKIYGDKLDLNHAGSIDLGLAESIAKARQRVDEK